MRRALFPIFFPPLFITSIYALACGVDDPCATGESTDVRLPAIILTAALACGPDDPMTTSSTTDDPTGSAAGDAGLEEACDPMPGPNSGWPGCREELICASESLIEGGMVIAGHCAHRCDSQNPCQDGQVCIEGACLFDCSESECPRIWLGCDDTIVDNAAICLGLGTF